MFLGDTITGAGGYGWGEFRLAGSKECILWNEGIGTTDLQQEITKQVELLPPVMQEQVLQFVISLTHPKPRGVRGEDLMVFAGSLDPDSAREMREAIEKECERIDADQW